MSRELRLWRAARQLLQTAFGAAAITYTFQALAKAGEHIVASRNDIWRILQSSGSYTALTSGITATFVDPEEEGAFERAIQKNTKAIFVETLGNPNSNVADLETLAELAHKHKIPLVVDSTFATPYLVRPIEHGADIVVHSATKFIGGHGTALGGVIIDSGRFDWKGSGKYPWISEPNPSYHGVSFTDAAPSASFATYIPCSPFEGYRSYPFPRSTLSFCCRGLEDSLSSGERHVENALKVVKYLANHPQVEAVHHPSLESESTHALYEKYFPQGRRLHLYL